MAELVDARDLKSLGPCDCESSILSPGTKINGRKPRFYEVSGLFCLWGHFFIVGLFVVLWRLFWYKVQQKLKQDARDIGGNVSNAEG